MRKPYLDTIRWAAVMLVLVYHVFYIFNGVGVLGGIPQAKNIPVFDTLAAVIYPWLMVLLFVVAGISARYALQKRTVRQFLRERVVKLLLPSTLGLFVIHWVTGYLNLKIGGGLAYIPKVLVYPIAVISGIGPLWFIQLLFVFCCALVLLTKLDKQDKVWALCGKTCLPVVVLLFVVLFWAAQFLNMPVFTMYRFGIYFTAFLIGYYVLSHGSVQDMLENVCVPMLCLAVVGAVVYGFYYAGRDFTAAACLQSLATNLYLWVVVLAVMGCFKRYCNRQTAFTRYMTKASFGIYILHYPVLLTACYILHNYFDLPAACNYAIALVVEFAGSFLLYELLKRIPLVRFVVLGIRKVKDCPKAGSL